MAPLGLKKVYYYEGGGKKDVKVCFSQEVADCRI